MRENSGFHGVSLSNAEMQDEFMQLLKKTEAQAATIRELVKQLITAEKSLDLLRRMLGQVDGGVENDSTIVDGSVRTSQLV